MNARIDETTFGKWPALRLSNDKLEIVIAELSAVKLLASARLHWNESGCGPIHIFHNAIQPERPTTWAVSTLAAGKKFFPRLIHVLSETRRGAISR